MRRIVPENAANRKTPASAANPYAGLKPRRGIEITSANQKIMFNTTAEPVPWTGEAEGIGVLGNAELVEDSIGERAGRCGTAGHHVTDREAGEIDAQQVVAARGEGVEH